ncbi:MAG TPA: hypothetical protein ENG05_03120, partial [Acidilobales archaeon]|nr:hypothetical protein [Acidilobales archaeon]
LGDVYVDYFSYQGEVISSITLLGKLQGINELRSFIKRAKDKGLETYSIETYRLSEDLCICLIVADTLLINSIRTSIKRFNVEVIDIPQVHIKVVDFLKDLESKVRKLGEEVKYVKSRLREIIDKSLRDIALAKALIPLIKERLDVLLAALMGRYLVGIEGWVPQTQYYLVENTLHGKLRYVFISSVRSDKKPPTKMRNPKPIRMFELITKIYGIPNYNEWDPTPIIAYSLMIFFGLMFADFIYGLVMFVIVMFVLERLGLVENPYSEGYRMFKKLLIVLSISSMFFGILSNSFAGYSIVLVNGSVRFVLATGGLGVNALLPIMDPMFFIKLALIIGLVHINIAHALALLKFWRGKVKGEFISKVGFFVAEIFGIPYVLYVFLGMELPPPFNYVADYLLYGAIGGLVLLILGKFMTYGGLAALFWLFDVTGLLGDVMSYTRLAGLGLATTLLAQNFNSLALGIASSLGSVVPLPMLGLILGVIASVIIIFLANMLNIAFGILGAFIHSLRLCFVEFLPKFYEGEGMEFKPFSMKLEKAVLVGMSR